LGWFRIHLDAVHLRADASWHASLGLWAGGEEPEPVLLELAAKVHTRALVAGHRTLERRRRLGPLRQLAPEGAVRAGAKAVNRSEAVVVRRRRPRARQASLEVRVEARPPEDVARRVPLIVAEAWPAVLRPPLTLVVSLRVPRVHVRIEGPRGLRRIQGSGVRV